MSSILRKAWAAILNDINDLDELEDPALQAVQVPGGATRLLVSLLSAIHATNGLCISALGVLLVLPRRITLPPSDDDSLSLFFMAFSSLWLAQATSLGVLAWLKETYKRLVRGEPDGLFPVGAVVALAAQMMIAGFVALWTLAWFVVMRPLVFGLSVFGALPIVWTVSVFQDLSWISPPPTAHTISRVQIQLLGSAEGVRSLPLPFRSG